MTVETDFHLFLHDFSPSLKFWGTKILVSLAFLQSLLLKVVPPFALWTDSRKNLLYAAILTAECFFITLMHVKAWNTEERWYSKEDKCKKQSVKEHLLS